MKPIFLILICLTALSQPVMGATYYISPSGNDSNNGTSSGTPWATPKHAVNCGDVLMAASGTYSEFSFAFGEWGTVTCSAANNVAWVECATFDACKVSASSVNGFGMDTSYWGVQGFEVTVTNADTFGVCFSVQPYGKSNTIIHHIVLANDICNGGQAGGFNASQYSSTATFDYVVFVGDIAFNTAQSNSGGYSGFDFYQPLNFDSSPGTHLFMDGNFSWGNVSPSSCGSFCYDGNGLFLDSINDGQGGGTPIYSGQIVVKNNLAMYNGNAGIGVGGSGNTNATILIEYNTIVNDGTFTSSAFNPCQDFEILDSYLVQFLNNLVQTRGSTGCNSVSQYAVGVIDSFSTVIVANDFLYSAAGNNIYASGNTGFTSGPGNVTGTNPNFVSTTEPSAPSCGSSASVPACMATVIANFTPTAATAKTYGYQAPISGSVFDPLFPQWLCNVNLPAGLVTMGCASVASTIGPGTTIFPGTSMIQ
jgi:hypothetical protein